MGLETLALWLAVNGPMKDTEITPKSIRKDSYTELVSNKNSAQKITSSNSSTTNAYPKVHVGLYGPFPDILDLRVACDFNDRFGVQANVGIGFIEADITTKIGNGPFYIYAGALTIAPWMYTISTEQPSSPSFGVEAGIGAKANLGGFTFGIEGGHVFPLPPDSNTGGPARGGIFVTYRVTE